MGRLQLLELADQPWFPRAWRDYVTDYLRFVMAHGPFDALPGLVARVAGEAGGRVVDLCSGAGGPWPDYLAAPRPELQGVRVVLTDRYPNRTGFERAQARTEGRAVGWSAPVDATDVPDELAGPRTMINGFHGFPPEEARAILADAVDDGVPIGVFEIVDRRPVTVLSLLLIPPFVFLLTPFIRPFRPGRLFWTYVVPVVPLVLWCDGVVSALRVYDPDELRKLVEGLDGYDWEIDSVPAGRGPPRITYLIGRPKPDRSEPA